jgi:endonuclease-3 related protein
MSVAHSLREAHDLLLNAYGPQRWWPGDTRFEIMVGAVLTQNTAWTNVEKALANLKRNDALSAEAILAARASKLARWLKPSGYFNIKAKRVKALCRWLVEQGGVKAVAKRPTDELRRELLAVHGVGPETADDILLYAFDRPVFVIDAYTRRIFRRMRLIAGDEGYEHLRQLFEKSLGEDAALYNEYHALIVVHGKDVCRTRPRCSGCCLRRRCPASKELA